MPGIDTLPRLIGEQSVYIEANPAHYALAGKSEHGRRTYISRLNQVARLFSFNSYKEVPWNLLRFEHVNYMVQVFRSRGLAYTTINTTLAALRSVAREAFNLRQLSGDDLARILHLKFERGSKLPSGRHIPTRDISALVQVCENDEGTSGRRDIAIIGLMYVCGLRRTEISQLVLGDFDLENNSITVGSKSDKARVCWPDLGTRHALLDWFKQCNAAMLDSQTPMFTPIRKSGKIVSRPMTDQSVYSMITKRWKQAGVRPCSPQDFRRSFVTNLLDKNVDVLLAQTLAGHSSPATTLRYDRRNEQVTKLLAEAQHLPYSSNLHDK
ncbi:MAG: tyrosine-type recombinase/integrase [Gammaproteobacteria bacterium]